MKKIVIKNEVAANLLSNLSAYRSKQNGIRFTIGMKSLGDGLASQVTIVNKGQMADIGFKTELPEDMSEFIEGTPYMLFNLKADDFCNYLGVMLDYKADISFEYDEKQLVLAVGEQVKIPLALIPDDNMEPLLARDHNNGLVRIEIKTEDFMMLLKKGGFLSKPDADSRMITDRVAFKFSGNRCAVYSSDSYSVAKAWCNADITYADAQRALYYLRVKGSGLSKEAQVEMMTEMKKYQTDPVGMIAYARQLGYVSDADFFISLPSASVLTLQKIFATVETLQIVITPDNFHVCAGNVLSIFALAGEVSKMYENTVDKWESAEWNAKVVTDKENLSRALNILKLGNTKIPFHLAMGGNGIAVSKEGNEIHTTALATDGNIGGIDSYFSVDRVLDALSKLSNGNLILRFVTDNANHPLSISNGSLNEENINSYAYILPVNMPSETATDENK